MLAWPRWEHTYNSNGINLRLAWLANVTNRDFFRILKLHGKVDSQQIYY